MQQNGAASVQPLVALGAAVGGAELIRAGQLANRHPPALQTHDRSGRSAMLLLPSPASPLTALRGCVARSPSFGNRIDEVDFHPAYHDLMAIGVRAGVHAHAYVHDQPGSHVTRAGLMYLMSQAESGVGCPLSMTYAGIPVLQAHPAGALAAVLRRVRRLLMYRRHSGQ